MRKAVLFSALLLAGCATRPPAQPPVAPPPAVVRPAPAAALPPSDYVARIASIEQFVVRASALGLERVRDPVIRRRIEALAADHRGLSAQLRMAGQRVNLLPSPVLGESERRWLTMLEGSQPFEIGLQRRLFQAHQEAVELHEAFAASGTSPTLRQFARYALGVERGHRTALLKERFLAR